MISTGDFRLPIEIFNPNKIGIRQLAIGNSVQD